MHEAPIRESSTDERTATISVCMLTYNQEKTVGRAIESVLCQKGDFRLQLVIGDDASTDETGTVCGEYAQNHPDTVIYIRNADNLGPVQNGLTVLEKCTGEFVAFIEGDDYWCCESKVAAQLAFLKTHPNHAMVYHGARVENERGEVTGHLYQYPGKDIRTMDDLCNRGSYIISTASIMGRNIFLDTTPYREIWRETSFIGDVFLKSLFLHAGKIGYIDREMSVYQQVVSGTSTFSSFSARRKHELISDSFKALIRFYPNERFPYAERKLEEYREEDHVLLSVIVPVGDSEDTFDAFLQRLYETAFEGFEAVFVIKSDCETARKAAVEWFRREHRFRYYLQDGGDVSEARNIGLEHARGKYVTFWDCDDEMDAPCYFHATKTLDDSRADLLVLNFKEVEERACVHTSKLDRRQIELESGPQLAEFLFTDFFHYKYGFQLWNKIFRRSLIEAHVLRFLPRRLVCAEDLLFCLCYLSKSHSLITEPSVAYTYIHRRGSLTDSTVLDFKINAYLEACLFIERALREDERLRPYINGCIAEMLMILCRENGQETVFAYLSRLQNPTLSHVLNRLVDSTALSLGTEQYAAQMLAGEMAEKLLLLRTKD